MIRTSPLRFLAAIAVLVIVTSCASYTAATDPRLTERTGYEQAKLQHVALSLDYEFVMLTLESAAKAGLLTSDQRKRLNDLQVEVMLWTPLVRKMLDAWGEYGAKPAAYSETFAHLTQAVADARTIKQEAGQ